MCDNARCSSVEGRVPSPLPWTLSWQKASGGTGSPVTGLSQPSGLTHLLPSVFSGQPFFPPTSVYVSVYICVGVYIYSQSYFKALCRKKWAINKTPSDYLQMSFRKDTKGTSTILSIVFWPYTYSVFGSLHGLPSCLSSSSGSLCYFSSQSAGCVYMCETY